MQAHTSPAPITPLEGEICEQFIRCGKQGCRCQNGQLHGPYYYRIWREGKTVRKVYVKASDREAVKAACDAHKTLARSLRDARQARLRLTHSIAKEWRQTQRLLAK